MKPILFKPEMVDAIQRGIKTQTRRIIMPPFVTCDNKLYRKDKNSKDYIPIKSKYGKKGETLYVREKWRTLKRFDHLPPSKIIQEPVHELFFRYWMGDNLESDEGIFGRWRSSLHMPKKIARIFLINEGIEYQRIQDITTQDIFAEGIDQESFPTHVNNDPENVANYAREEFRHLWDYINKKPRPLSYKGRIWAYVNFPFDGPDYKQSIYNKKRLYTYGNPYVEVLHFTVKEETLAY